MTDPTTGQYAKTPGGDPLHEPMLQFFRYDHLPPHLRSTSMWFWDLATIMIKELPRNPERTVALRKLLEAKDCAVRAKLYAG